MVHVVVMGVVTAVIALGGINAVRSESSSGTLARSAQSLVGETGRGGTEVVDTTASAFIAADVANALEMPAAEVVTEHAENLGSQVTNVTSGSQYAVKTQTVATSVASRNIKSYTIVSGDTVESVGQKFSLSAETVAWANDISVSTRLLPGSQLSILPVNGVLHTIAEGDTAQSLAEKYQSNAAQIVAFNDLEVSGMQPGAQIIIPDGVKPQVASASTGFSNLLVPRFGSNGYDYGYCTWYAKNKRPDLPSNLGNAVSWYWNAARAGFGVGGSPSVGAVAWEPIGGLGHVAVVEEVNGDQVRVSEMNQNGWGVVSSRWESASHFRYIY